MSDVPTLSQVLALLDNRADPRTAEGWDRVGLVTGDPQQRVRRVMFAVDDIDDVVERLLVHGAELVGELAQYEDMYRLCYVRGPEGIVVGLAQQLS